MRLKTLLNNCFLLILLDKKREGDKYLENKRAKIKIAFFEDGFWIITPYWLLFYFSKINIDICRKDYIRKSKKINLDLSIIDRNKKINNSDEKINNLNIGIVDINIDKKIDNQS